MSEGDEAPVSWGRRVLGHLGVCVVEAGLAAVLLAAIVLIAAPLILGSEGGMELWCAAFILILWAPVVFLGCVVVFVLAKGLVEALPAARRHLALAVYWALGIGIGAWVVVDSASSSATCPSRRGGAKKPATATARSSPTRPSAPRGAATR